MKTKKHNKMNSFFKTIRIATDIVILAVMSLELKDQIVKIKQRKATTVAAARATQEDKPNE